MTFASLSANVTVMKAGNLSQLTDPLTGATYTATALTALYKDEAKEILEQDLITALSIDQENTTDLDDTVDLNEDELAKALAYLQLHLIFLDKDDGDGSQARFRAVHYDKRYREYKDRFPYINKRTQTESYTVHGAMTIG